uniref:Uncharacterized protein n=1 Tax=Sphingobacterium sp. (strain 21) TaxID=743722 RepID=F4C6P6_SPHS2
MHTYSTKYLKNKQKPITKNRKTPKLSTTDTIEALIQTTIAPSLNNPTLK